jgi:hypothetical protein
MTFTPEQVETIVLEVIRRLGLFDTNPKREQGDDGVAVGERSSTTADLTLTEKVITMRLVEKRLTGITRLVVARRAVVTPAVKDELKKHKIELIREN